jgi:hypothetical protein
MKSNQRYLKFPQPVILNLFQDQGLRFQDLNLWKERDAEPSSA